MSIITLDFETYYSREYSLSKLSMEQYINDPRFQIIGVGVKMDDLPSEWFSGTFHEIGDYLAQYDIKHCALLCHNAYFDGAILAWKYNIQPAFYFDTMCMCKITDGVLESASLKAMSERHGTGVKGSDLTASIGKQLLDFSTEGLRAFGMYCKNDVEITRKLFDKLAEGFPESEIALIDLTIRMFTQPTLEIDSFLLMQKLAEIKAVKSEVLSALMNKLQCTTEEEVRKKLSSNKEFAKVLGELGVMVPMKESPATGKQTYALAKNDQGFIELMENPDLYVQEICAARLGVKSTMEESRIERFIDIGIRNHGRLPVPLKYCAAHTLRWGGMDGINIQNLPSRNKDKRTLKNSIRAPAGHVIVHGDSSQIEARKLAWWAGQDNVLDLFRQGEDVYCHDASDIYGRHITKADDRERFVGKTCIGLGSKVLCERGWIAIEKILPGDRVWDGQMWVGHAGVICNGLKPTLSLCGLWLTPDHTVWSGTKWWPALYVAEEESILSQALATAAENLPLRDTFVGRKDLTPSSLNAPVTDRSTRSIPTILEILNRLAAMFAQKMRLQKNAGGSMQKLCQMTGIEPDCLIGWPQLSQGAIASLQTDMNTTASVEYQYLKSGERIGQHSLDTYRPYRDGITPVYKWTEGTITEITPPVISDFLRQLRTCLIGEKSQTLRRRMPVYDLLSCGPRNRFTVLTDRGPLIVHNCRLGLGYGTGAEKLRHMLATSAMSIDLPLVVCGELVNKWRFANHRIRELWAEANQALYDVMAWPENKKWYWLGEHQVVLVTPLGFKLPNNTFIRYKNLRIVERGKIVHDSRYGMSPIWGGTVVENVTQALARITIGEQMVNIATRYRPVLTVHDSIAIVATEQGQREAMECMDFYLSQSPLWAVDLPLACEIKVGQSYGEC